MRQQPMITHPAEYQRGDGKVFPNRYLVTLKGPNGEIFTRPYPDIPDTSKGLLYKGFEVIKVEPYADHINRRIEEIRRRK